MMEHILKIVLGNNYFSLSELAHLKAGDLILTTALAGRPQVLYWNNQAVARGELVVVDQNFGFRVASLDVNQENYTYPGVKEQLLDIVQGEVVISQKKVTSQELFQIKEGSVIYFGNHIDDEVSLFISSSEIARGKVGVRDENFVFYTTSVIGLKDLESALYPYKSTGNILKDDQDDLNYKLYDFMRPDKFSLRQITNLCKIHSRLINNVSFNSKNPLKARIKSVDQLTYEEFWKQAKSFKVDQYKFYQGKSKVKIGNFVNLESADYKLTQKEIDQINKFCQPLRVQDFYFLLVYQQDNSFTNKDIFEISCKKAWEFVGHIEPDLVQKAVSLEKILQIIPPKDMICIVEIDYEEKGKKGKLVVLYPYITIEDTLPALEEADF
ncbi:MAG: FliM/FliN family flagellar motor switch protein [Spirochaetes bacterium]|nr:FliM/FliN family flagellar motor switch protein [Spirochaetota bacterium]